MLHLLSTYNKGIIIMSRDSSPPRSSSPTPISLGESPIKERPSPAALATITPLPDSPGTQTPPAQEDVGSHGIEASPPADTTATPYPTPSTETREIKSPAPTDINKSSDVAPDELTTKLENIQTSETSAQASAKTEEKKEQLCCAHDKAHNTKSSNKKLGALLIALGSVALYSKNIIQNFLGKTPVAPLVNKHPNIAVAAIAIIGTIAIASGIANCIARTRNSGHTANVEGSRGRASAGVAR